MKIIELGEIDSTNEYCKRRGKENLIVTAVSQTSGKGTKGRSYVSDEGGLYLSVMRHYDNFLSCNAFKIMVNACVAVCRTVQSFGLKPVIRWANDVLVNGKKICGTLIENTFSGSYISRSIVGMGINVNNKLPYELKNIATSLSAELGKPVDIKAVRSELVKNLQKDYTAIAVDVDYDGGLLCVIAGSVNKINSAEVSLRLK